MSDVYIGVIVTALVIAATLGTVTGALFVTYGIEYLFSL